MRHVFAISTVFRPSRYYEVSDISELMWKAILSGQHCTDTHAMSDLGNFVHFIINFVDVDTAMICFYPEIYT